ncbi:YkvA family protein [Haliea sp. E17]|uniref:YkvA family protein n=1 Tax=Haliea sp. E17 TaxID=3401576 RepID=UPI003AAD56A6
MTDENPYPEAYSEQGLKEKLAGYAKSAGREVVEKVLLLYYALQRADTPTWARATIIGALGYFIAPLDAIADFTPLLGYSDDLGVLALALATVASQIDEDVRHKAAAKLESWFGTAPAPAQPNDAAEDT